MEHGYTEALKREAKRISQFNTDSTKINLRNGVLDLNKFKLEPHREDFYSTIQIPINYNESAKCPVFDKFIMDICSQDTEMVQLIAEIMGYVLTVDTSAQKSFMLVGEGSNGKSTLLDIIRAIVGNENVSAVSLRDINSSSFRRKAIVGKTVNILTENEFGKYGFQTEYFKKIVGGDLVSAEIKGGDMFNFTPTCKMLFAMNKLPQTQDLSFGFRRRIIILPFDEMFTGENADKNIAEKLKSEYAGILLFALRGLKLLRANNYEFTIPKRCKEAIEQYFDNLDHVGAFAKYNIHVVDNGKIKYEELYRSFLQWAIREEYEVNINRTGFAAGQQHLLF